MDIDRRIVLAFDCRQLDSGPVNQMAYYFSGLTTQRGHKYHACPEAVDHPGNPESLPPWMQVNLIALLTLRSFNRDSQDEGGREDADAAFALVVR
jgi:hypothetical protein